MLDSTPRTCLAAALTALFLVACGGGGGSADNGAEKFDSVLQASCDRAQDRFCGALSNHQYSGSGVGLWQYTNTAAEQVLAPVYLSGLGERSITVVYTNPGDGAVDLPADLRLQTLPQQTRTVAAAYGTASQDALRGINAIPARVREFDAQARLQAQAQAQAQPDAHHAFRLGSALRSAGYAVGQSRSWYVSDADNRIDTRYATLQRQITASDGRILNLWLEDSEYASERISDTVLDTLLEKFGRAQDSVYGMVTQLAGQPWGSHRYSDLIGGTQALDIVLVNFDRNRRPYGLLGYFWSANNFVRKASDATLQYSNESLSFYLDTETIYLDTERGLVTQLSTLAHEFLHMVNFYQRMVSMEPSREGSFYGFETFLEEMTALMMEDIVGLKLSPDYHSVRDNRVHSWLANASYNCGLTNWIGDSQSGCFSYPVAASFGAHLLRHYGIGFYTALLRNNSSTDSLAVLQNAIAGRGGNTLGTELVRWANSIALLPADASPAGFGFPQREDLGYTLPAIDGPAYAQIRTLPRSVPAQLQPHASFPFLRSASGGIYQETLPVPAGATVSVIVH